MVIHHANSNSFWVGPLKNQKEGALIAAWAVILKRAPTRNSTQSPNHRQPTQRTHETRHRVNKTGRRIYIKNDVRTRSSRRSSKKLVRKINWNLQGPFHQSPKWMRERNANALMVPTATTGRTAITTTTIVVSEPRHAGICTCIPSTTQLQQASIRSNRNEIPHAHKTTQTANIRTTLWKEIRHRHIVQTLPMPDNLDDGHAQAHV